MIFDVIFGIFVRSKEDIVVGLRSIKIVCMFMSFLVIMVIIVKDICAVFVGTMFC